jgi:glycosyltransferase 2 family protein
MSTELDAGAWVRRIISLAGSLWARAGVTLLLLAIVASGLDWSLIERRLSDGRPLDFLLAVSLVAFALAVGAYRWHALLEAAEIRLSASRLARIYAVSTFSSSFLPTTAGGDVTRALLVARRGPALARTVVSILVDRVGGLVGMIGIAWVALALQPGTVPIGVQAILGWTTIAFVLGGALVGAAAFGGSRIARRVVPDRFIAIARDSRLVLLGYARDSRLLLKWALSSFAYQLLIAAQLVALAHAIDLELPFATAAVSLTIVTVVTLVPISIGGFGVREASYVVLLGSATIGASDAALISILSVATLLVASLPGAYLIITGNVGATPDAVPG